MLTTPAPQRTSVQDPMQFFHRECFPPSHDLTPKLTLGIIASGKNQSDLGYRSMEMIIRDELQAQRILLHAGSETEEAVKQLRQAAQFNKRFDGNTLRQATIDEVVSGSDIALICSPEHPFAKTLEDRFNEHIADTLAVADRFRGYKGIVVMATRPTGLLSQVFKERAQLEPAQVLGFCYEWTRFVRNATQDPKALVVGDPEMDYLVVANNSVGYPLLMRVHSLAAPQGVEERASSVSAFLADLQKGEVVNALLPRKGSYFAQPAVLAGKRIYAQPIERLFSPEHLDLCERANRSTGRVYAQVRTYGMLERGSWKQEPTSLAPKDPPENRSAQRLSAIEEEHKRKTRMLHALQVGLGAVSLAAMLFTYQPWKHFSPSAGTLSNVSSSAMPLPAQGIVDAGDGVDPDAQYRSFTPPGKDPDKVYEPILVFVKGIPDEERDKYVRIADRGTRAVNLLRNGSPKAFDAELELKADEARYQDPVSAMYLAGISGLKGDYDGVATYAQRFLDHNHGNVRMDGQAYDMMQYLLLSYQQRLPERPQPYQLLGRLELSFGKDPAAYFAKHESLSRKREK